jgi:hypothetical protein
MGYQVISYEVAEQLMFHDSLFADYRDAIHITATNSLKRGMMESNSELNYWFNGPILSFSELAKYIGNSWFLGRTELQQFTTLSKVLRQFNNTQKNYSIELFSSIDKNQESTIKTIRLLVESGLSSDDVINAVNNNFTEEERIFLQLWRDLESTNSFLSFREWIKKFNTNTIDSFANTLISALEQLKKDDSKRIKANLSPNPDIKNLVEKQFVERKVIVLHGFYFILPIQKRIFDQLSKHIKVVHVVNYIEGYDNGFKAIEAFLNLPSTPHMQSSKTNLPVNSNAKKFLKVINGIFSNEEEKYITTRTMPNYFEFNNLHQFKKFVENKDDVLVSPRSREVKSYLEDIYTTKNHKLTQYPMGQFLLDIHRLNTRKYDINKQEYKDVENLSMPLVLRLFNSGYLMIDGEIATKYLKSLQKLTPILEDLTTFREWRKCIKELMSKKMRIESKLKHKLTNEDLDHNMNTYYNRNLAFFNISQKALKGIYKGINNLEGLYKDLYSGNAIPIKDYIKILEEFVSNDVLPNLQQEVDQKVANKILESLADFKGVQTESFDRQDLMRGLNYFLSREADKDDDEDEFSGDHLDKSETISALLNSDGLQFSDNRSIHFAFMDNKAFPNSQKLNTWPLSVETIEALYEKNVNIKQLKMRKDLEVDIACYLLFIIMNNAINVKFSIVKELNHEKKLEESFYLKLLDLNKASKEDMNSSNGINQTVRKQKTKKLNFYKRRYEILIRKTYNRCPKRVVYSFLLKNRPEFSSFYHETFVFQNLLRRVLNQRTSKKHLLEQYNEIYSWFPHWSQTKKDMYRENIEEYLRLNPDGRINYTILDGYNYSDAQVNLALFGQPSPKEVRDKANFDFHVSKKPIANPGPNCKYCPFQDQCVEADLYQRGN